MQSLRVIRWNSRRLPGARVHLQQFSNVAATSATQLDDAAGMNATQVAHAPVRHLGVLSVHAGEYAPAQDTFRLACVVEVRTKKAPWRRFRLVCCCQSRLTIIVYECVPVSFRRSPRLVRPFGLTPASSGAGKPATPRYAQAAEVKNAVSLAMAKYNNKIPSLQIVKDCERVNCRRRRNAVLDVVVETARDAGDSR